MSETPRFTPAQLRAEADWHDTTSHRLTAKYLRYAADVLEAQPRLEEKFDKCFDAYQKALSRAEQAEAKLADVLAAGEPERTP